jgi:peptide/nickel transport system permease protein
VSSIALITGFERVAELLADGGWLDRTIAVSPFLLAVGAGLYLYLARTDARDKTMLQSLFRNTEIQWGMTVVVGIALLAVFAPILTSHDPQYALYGRLRPPSLLHPLGTDTSGRDAFARLLYGARLSLQTGVFATFIATALGTTVGVVSALSGSRTDSMLMRVVDAGLAFPRVFLLLALIALLPTVSQGLLVLVLGLTSWFDIARLVRGETLSLRSSDYVTATTGLGLPASRVVGSHILPNLAGPITVSASLSLGYLILLESGLSYLGVGASAGTPSWGRLIQEGYSQLRNAPQLTLIPGALIALTVIGFSLLGDGLRQHLDPRKA